jgi:hypothetical protein
MLTEGFQPYLIIGMIETADRKALRKAVIGFMDNIKADDLYNSIPSVASQEGWYVHFQEAVDRAFADKAAIENISYNLEIVPGKDMPELSIIDYLIWAVQRSLIHGESRYFTALRDNYEIVMNLFGENVVK